MPKTIRFNTRIYKKEAVQKAILAFSNLAKFSLFGNSSYLKVKIVNISPSVKKVIVDEFTNYVLIETKRCL